MSLEQQNQISAEERKKNREKFMIKDKENETLYRHYGELNGADFKLRKNKNCEIYILDLSKGMYIDDCEDCKIFCGPIDGSVFIRGSKNCQFSIIARQVRFRSCENLKVFTYCPSDPAVESSFNIYFAPFNAFFPHLKELFVKGEFKKEEKNHIDTPYDFTPTEELGGGAPHHLKLPEDEFFIKVINDGDAPVEEMFDGYSEEEPWIKNKSSELPNFEQKVDNNNNDDFNFINENDNENKKDNDNKPSLQPTLNDFMTFPNNNQNEQKNNNDNNFMNMDDFLSGDNNLTDIQNKQNTMPDFNTNSNNNNDFFFNNNNNNNSKDNNNNFMDMNDFLGGNSNNSKPKQSYEFNNLNMNNNQNNNNFSNNLFNNNNNFNTFNMSNNSKETEEEMKRVEMRNKEKEMRQAKIRKKMEKEEKMRMEIMAKAREYINQFHEERKKRIALNHEKLMQSSSNQNNNNDNGPWGMVQSSFTGSTSQADRMKEVIMNKNRDQSH